MRIRADIVRTLCRDRGTTLGRVLREAGVSRNAYYSLARKDTVLPRSVRALAERLGVPPSAFLEDERAVLADARRLLLETDRICRRCPGADPENVRHTLLLLRQEPIDRLRRALLRGGARDVH